ncbi:universal stress protein [Sphingobacterium wenxiniae]|uniref:Nucleotide-binding universal stress protein, UspA family n=1 Tax=Sphingobacterium wenxiniae TaxID=683125 RepID=A0A1I6NRK3_9SPHI|nr:universal stress protein [Sphingobacterium wenxiniae]SFS30530.1 Nucleotide-binding universal stress protein, UspA family [Sphingobacterium wenxiniae]
MRKILFPTDFSEAANNAFLYALNLAKEMQGELYVLNTYMQPVLSANHAGQPELIPEVYENYELQQFENFKRHSTKLRELASEHGLADVGMTFLFQEGTVVSNVQRVIDKEDIKLIIMGTNRAEGIIDKLFGSNTVGVIRGVKIPVLSVPKEAKFQGIKEIAFTTLFREKDEAALHEIMEIALKFGVKVKCIHVVKDNSADVIGIAEKWRKNYREENLEFIFLDLEESVAKTLNKYLSEHRVDLLCVIRRNRNLLDSLFRSSISSSLRIHTNTATIVFNEGQFN